MLILQYKCLTIFLNNTSWIIINKTNLVFHYDIFILNYITSIQSADIGIGENNTELLQIFEAFFIASQCIMIIQKFQDLQTKQEITAKFKFRVQRSPLLVQIVGGQRIQNYLKSFHIQIQSKDPDLQVEWNQDPEIILSVDLVLINWGKLFIQIKHKIYNISARLFRPFTVLQFRVICSKQNLKASTSATIILLDEEIPTINVSYPQGYQIRDVNINEKLKFQIIIDKNQIFKDMDFSFALIYNYETVYIRSIPNQIVEFAIWEGFQKFNFINQISVKFQAHNINQLMPQIASVTLTVNMPPVNSIITIQPQIGNAAATEYTIIAINSKDQDSPIQYRHAYYESQKLYQQEILSGNSENMIIYLDFSPVQQHKTILESGNLTILISVSDSLGSIANYTQQIIALSFYEQWQLDSDIQTNISSKCKQMVSDLQIILDDIQQLIITSLELMKLLEKNIQQDCIATIHQQLQKNQQVLFQQLITVSNNILKSRISNVHSKIYELNIQNHSRQLNSQEDSQICYNISSNQLQVTQLKQIALNQSDSEQVINNISQISIQIQKAIQKIQNLYMISQLHKTQVMSKHQEVYYKILNQEKVMQDYQEAYLISGLIDQLMDSFQINLDLDATGITLSTQGLGVQVYKIGQMNFQKFIIMKQVDPEDNFSNLIINRYIQLVKYKNNKYFYTENFNNTFSVIYVDNVNQVTKVLKVYDGKLAFRMGINVNRCNSSENMSYDKTKDYQFICSSYINQKWVHNGCQIELFTDKRGQINVKCNCDQLYPLAVMIMNTSNVTKTQFPQKPIINFQEYINILIIENITIHTILFIFLILLALIVNYIYLSFNARLILTSININVLLTAIHILNVIIKNHLLSAVISIFISLILQLVIKVLEGFFNGPKVLKVYHVFLQYLQYKIQQNK